MNSNAQVIGLSKGTIIKSKPWKTRFSDFYGNGQALGTFVYCGFKPRWLMITRSDAAGYHWRIYWSVSGH